MPSALLRPFVMAFVTTALAPSPALFAEGAVLVNKKGERFADELDRPAFAVPDQEDKVAFILLDARVTSLFSAWPNFISTAPGVAYAYIDDYRRNRADVFVSAPTLDALASKLNMPATALQATVESHNLSAGNRPPIGGGPYVALGPVRAVFVHAEGGLAVDREHRVLGRATSRSRVFLLRALPGKAACCLGDTGIILPGLSPRVGARAGTRPLRRRRSIRSTDQTGSSLTGDVMTRNTRSTSPVF